MGLIPDCGSYYYGREFQLIRGSEIESLWVECALGAALISIVKLSPRARIHAMMAKKEEILLIFKAGNADASLSFWQDDKDACVLLCKSGRECEWQEMCARSECHIPEPISSSFSSVSRQVSLVWRPLAIHQTWPLEQNKARCIEKQPGDVKKWHVIFRSEQV